MTEPEARGRPGRRRSEDSRQAILTAALALTAERGYAGLSIEGIAARSGTGKQTVYRWWPSKGDVLLEAVAVNADVHVPLTDTGSYAGDLRAFLTATFALGRDEALVSVLRALMAQAQLDPEFGERFRVGFLQRRRDALAGLLERAEQRGDRPPTPGPEIVCDLVFGAVWYRLLATTRPLDAPLAEDLVATLTQPTLK